MFIFVIFAILLVGNWLLTNALVFLPISILDRFNSLGTMTIGFILLLFLAWCLGDE